tara:strand:- start:307 stop:768 length:462 start_codon:yes stop_codon:yes gene_type:complete
MIRKLFLFCILLLLTNCGYEPIYVKSNNSYLNFGEINTSGNEKINKRILALTGIEKRSGNSSSYLLILDSKKQREIVAKNSAGNATSYKISIKIKISLTDPIDKEKIIKSKEFNSSFTYNNAENKFQLSQDEKNILNNLIESTSEKIVIYLNS